MEHTEYDGLVRLIEANHKETLRNHEDLTDWMKDMDDAVTSHDRSITRIKTIGGIGGAIWTAVLFVFAAIFKG